MKRDASQKVKEITPVIDVQPSVNSRGKLLLCLVIFEDFEMWSGKSFKPPSPIQALSQVDL